MSENEEEKPQFPTEQDVEGLIEILDLYEVKYRAATRILDPIIGLSDNQLSVFYYLAKHSTEEITPTDLVDLLNLNKATITGHLDKLVERGLVKKVPSQKDRRKTFLSLTPRGGEFHDKIMQIRRVILKNLLLVVNAPVFRRIRAMANFILGQIDRKLDEIQAMARDFTDRYGEHPFIHAPKDEIMAGLEKVLPFLFRDLSGVDLKDAAEFVK